MNQAPQKNIRAEVSGTFGASGTLTLVISASIGYAWELKQITIDSTSTLEPLAKTYIGTSAAGIPISKSFTGNDDTDSQPNVTLRTGDSIACVWTGGTAGATARLTVIYDEVEY